MTHQSARSGAIVVCAMMLATVLRGAPATAQTPPASNPAPAGPSTTAFQDAYAVSFYDFDACGDQVAGRIYRQALTERLSSCPFPPEARAHFRQWSAGQRRKSSSAIAALVERNGGGLPVKLDGMNSTCRELRASPDYVALRGRLEQYADGLLHVDAHRAAGLRRDEHLAVIAAALPAREGRRGDQLLGPRSIE